MVHNNIDFIAATSGFEIVEKAKIARKGDIETLVNKSLGVLSSNGVYALWLFIQSEESDEIINLINILTNFSIELNGSNPEDIIINLSNDVNKLLFINNLMEKTLIYARYRAKAIM